MCFFSFLSGHMFLLKNDDLQQVKDFPVAKNLNFHTQGSFSNTCMHFFKFACNLLKGSFNIRN